RVGHTARGKGTEIGLDQFVEVSAPIVRRKALAHEVREVVAGDAFRDDLPVQRYYGSLVVEQQVVETVVAVHDRHRVPVWHTQQIARRARKPITNSLDLAIKVVTHERDERVP